MVTPRRPKLGQHFLADTAYRNRIVEALGLRRDDLVIEIGPGQGAMTPLLASRVRQVVAVEVDPELARKLRARFPQGSGVEIAHADILETDLAALRRRFATDRCFVFGNIPYYITSPIIHHLLRFAGEIRAMGLLVQREVADRLTAHPGTRDYGYLTVWTRYHSCAQTLFDVPPGAFSPPPKVHSTLVRFTMRSWEEPQAVFEEQLREFLKQSFAHKRKKLLNCLAAVYPREQVERGLENAGLPLTVRAEELTLDQFLELFDRLQ